MHYISLEIARPRNNNSGSETDSTTSSAEASTNNPEIDPRNWWVKLDTASIVAKAEEHGIEPTIFRTRNREEREEFTLYKFSSDNVPLHQDLDIYLPLNTNSMNTYIHHRVMHDEGTERVLTLDIFWEIDTAGNIFQFESTFLPLNNLIKIKLNADRSDFIRTEYPGLDESRTIDVRTEPASIVKFDHINPHITFCDLILKRNFGEYSEPSSAGGPSHVEDEEEWV